MKNVEEKLDHPFFAFMDFAKNPVFILSQETPLGFNGQFYVNGQLRTSVFDAILREDESDLFAAIVHLHKTRDNFQGDVLKFTGVEILRLMNWSVDGPSYERLRKAAENLFAARVFVKNVFEDGSSRERASRLIQDYDIWDRSKAQTARNAKDKNEIALSRRVLEKCRNGDLKAVHPIYFSLKRAQEKRMFILISVRASDLLQWDIRLTELKDLIPLYGKSYDKIGQVRAKIERILDGLLTKSIIRKYEFIRKTPATESLLSIFPNHEYFYSKQAPKSLSNIQEESEREPKLEKKKNKNPKKTNVARTLATEKNEHPLVAKLVEYGVSPVSTAVRLVFDTENGVERAAAQIKHLEYRISINMPPRNFGAFLSSAITENYALPPDMEQKILESKEQKIRILLQEVDVLSRRTDDAKSLDLAIRKAQDILEKIGNESESSIANKCRGVISSSEHHLRLLSDPLYRAEHKRSQAEAMRKAREHLGY